MDDLTDEQKIERDIEALAQLIYDIYQDKKAQETMQNEQPDNE